MNTNRKTVPSFTYPEPQSYRGGAKVRWRYYTDRATAEKAAAVAQSEGDYKRELGFDFGYCMPGSLANAQRNGVAMFEVCCP